MNLSSLVDQKHTKTHKTNIAAFALLFIPSVNFWCTGISKDTLMFISIFYLLFYFFDFFLNKKAFLIKHVFWIVVIELCFVVFAGNVHIKSCYLIFCEYIAACSF